MEGSRIGMAIDLYFHKALDKILYGSPGAKLEKCDLGDVIG